MKNSLKAIVLVSGGIDSCVTAAIAKDKKYNLSFLHLNYGQRTEKRELEAFNKIADFFSIKNKLIVDISYLTEIGGSCLTDKNIAIPKNNLHNSKIPISYVPFRNANILSIAVSWAESINAKAIFIGAVEEDAPGYPDCRRSFFTAFEKIIETGTKPETKIKILSPLIKFTKEDIVRKGVNLNAPLHLTWSCYENDNIPCKECDSCLLREQGFALAGFRDPIFK